MYDYMAEIMDADVPEAMPAETATLKEVAKSTTWGKYHSPSQIPSAVGRHVIQAGADTMIQNAKRDKAQWAWVPQGDTCAFCITLASRGWQNASRTVLRGNHAEHIHQNCDCTFAIAFKEKDKRQYDYIYDPKKYEDMYYGADGFTSDARINALRRDIYQQNKDQINAQKRDAYQAKKLSLSGDPGGNNSGKDNNEPLRITQIRASYITELVNNGTYSLKLSYQNYNKHLEGHRDYERYKDSRIKKKKTPPSILTISYDEAQEIIVKQSGHGIIKVRKDGTPMNMEMITCDRIVGKYFSRGEWYYTNKAIIHYGSDGSHLVPHKGSNYD